MKKFLLPIFALLVIALTSGCGHITRQRMILPENTQEIQSIEIVTYAGEHRSVTDKDQIMR